MTLTQEQLADAATLLRRLCVHVDDVNSTGYRLVASKYGMTPEALREVVVVYRKERARKYMRDYMRRRRGGLKRKSAEG